MKKTTVKCPKCGTEIPVALSSTKRLELLKKSGVDVSGLFALKNGQGIAKMEDGEITILDDNDPIFDYIKENGYIENNHLFRRWVMAQVLRMMSSKKGFHKSLLDKGYEYSLRMIENELLVQSKIENKDKEAFDERRLFFDWYVVREMINDYCNKLYYYLKNDVKQRNCKGVPYIRYKGKDVFVEDIEKKIISKIRIKYVYPIHEDCPTTQLYEIIRDFNKEHVKLHNYTRMSDFFISAYKGAGAYYTLKNCIMFHGLRIDGKDIEDSLEKLWSIAALQKFTSLSPDKYKSGYKLFGFMKEVFRDNNFDIEKKISEWSK